MNSGGNYLPGQCWIDAGLPAERLCQASPRAKGTETGASQGGLAIKRKDKKQPSFLSPTHQVPSKWAERSWGVMLMGVPAR